MESWLCRDNGRIPGGTSPNTLAGVRGGVRSRRADAGRRRLARGVSTAAPRSSLSSSRCGVLPTYTSRLEGKASVLSSRGLSRSSSSWACIEVMSRAPEGRRTIGRLSSDRTLPGSPPPSSASPAARPVGESERLRPLRGRIDVASPSHASPPPNLWSSPTSARPRAALLSGSGADEGHGPGLRALSKSGCESGCETTVPTSALSARRPRGGDARRLLRSPGRCRWHLGTERRRGSAAATEPVLRDHDPVGEAGPGELPRVQRSPRGVTRKSAAPSSCSRLGLSTRGSEERVDGERSGGARAEPGVVPPRGRVCRRAWRGSTGATCGTCATKRAKKMPLRRGAGWSTTAAPSASRT